MQGIYSRSLCKSLLFHLARPRDAADLIEAPLGGVPPPPVGSGHSAIGVRCFAGSWQVPGRFLASSGQVLVKFWASSRQDGEAENIEKSRPKYVQKSTFWEPKSTFWRPKSIQKGSRRPTLHLNRQKGEKRRCVLTLGTDFGAIREPREDPKQSKITKNASQK